MARHIGWKSTALVDYYTQVQKVMNTPLFQMPWLAVRLTMATGSLQIVLKILSVDAIFWFHFSFRLSSALVWILVVSFGS